MAPLLACAMLADAAPASGTLLVLNKSDDTVSLIDLPSKQTLATLPSGSGPHEVVISPDGRTAVVSNYGARQPGRSLTVIDLLGREVRGTIDLGEHTRPHGLAWLQDEQVAITTEGSRSLLIVDIAQGRVVSAIETRQDTSHMVVASNRHGRAYVANIGSGSVTVIDLHKRQVIKHIETGAGAEGIAISPDESQLWITNREANTISILDAASLEIEATLASSAFPIRAKFTPDGHYVLVSNARSGDVAVFEVATRKELRRIPMDVEASEAGSGEQRIFGDRFGQSPVPVGILVVPQSDLAYVANTNADIVSVIDLASWRVVDRILAGKEPDGLGYSPLSLR